MVNQKYVGYSLIGLAVLLFVILVVVQVEFNTQAAFLCEQIDANPHQTMEECPAHKSTTPMLITISFLLVIIILVIGILLLYVPAKIKKKLPALDYEEKLIVDEIRKTGSAYQSDLIKATGFSKVKMTRILDKLEGKGVIERRRRGMTNIIFLR
ncbi:MarR family transcriptional regulator [Candidatus Woesearchaeota archaeon]|nr:MAG: MarR family transcriptional regulator [Candidatus Woesearchaeota archaeon]